MTFKIWLKLAKSVVWEEKKNPIVYSVDSQQNDIDEKSSLEPLAQVSFKCTGNWQGYAN